MTLSCFHIHKFCHCSERPALINSISFIFFFCNRSLWQHTTYNVPLDLNEKALWKIECWECEGKKSIDNNILFSSKHEVGFDAATAVFFVTLFFLYDEWILLLLLLLSGATTKGAQNNERLFCIIRNTGSRKLVCILRNTVYMFIRFTWWTCSFMPSQFL